VADRLMSELVTPPNIPWLSCVINCFIVLCSIRNFCNTSHFRDFSFKPVGCLRLIIRLNSCSTKLLLLMLL